MAHTVGTAAFIGTLLAGGLLFSTCGGEPADEGNSSLSGDGLGVKGRNELPVDLAPYRRAFDNVRPRCWWAIPTDLYYAPDPREGQSVVTAPTFQPGVVVEITPDLKKLQAVGLTVEDLREACHFYRFSHGNWKLEVNGKRRLWEAGAEIHVEIEQKGKLIDLATLAAIRIGKMKPRTIHLRMADGRGVRVSPDVEKIGKYLITLEDFEYALWYVPHCIPITRDDMGVNGQEPKPIGLLSAPVVGDFIGREPASVLVLGRLRVPDSRVASPTTTYVADGNRFMVHDTGLGVPLESLARVEVVGARKIAGITIDPFQTKPEDDCIIRVAKAFEAVRAQVKDDPLLRPLSEAKLQVSDRSLRSRVLGTPDKHWYVTLRAETSEVFHDRYDGEQDRRHGWLDVSVRSQAGPAQGMSARVFVPSQVAFEDSTTLTIPDVAASVQVHTLTSNRESHRRLVGILVQELARGGIPTAVDKAL